MKYNRRRYDAKKRIQRFCHRQGWFIVSALTFVVLTNLLRGGNLWLGVGLVTVIALGFDIREEATLENLRQINRLYWTIQNKDEIITTLEGGLNATTAKSVEATARMNGMRKEAERLLGGSERAAAESILRAGYFTLPGEDVEYDETWLISGDAHHG